MPTLDFFQSVPGRGLVPIGLDGREVTDFEGICAIAEAFARRRGFKHYFLCFRMFAGASARVERVKSNFPIDWLLRYQHCGYVNHDPVMRAWRESLVPFTWSSLRRDHPQSEEFYSDAASHGLKDALVVPWNGGRGACGMFSLVSDVGRLAPADVQECSGEALLFAFYLFKAMVDMVRRACPRGSGPVMTLRQREVLLLISQGKSYKAVASTLGIDWTSARTLLQRAVAALGVSSREEAIVLAVESGELYLSSSPAAFESHGGENPVRSHP